MKLKVLVMKSKTKTTKIKPKKETCVTMETTERSTKLIAKARDARDVLNLRNSYPMQNGHIITLSSPSRLSDDEILEIAALTDAAWPASNDEEYGMGLHNLPNNTRFMLWAICHSDGKVIGIAGFGLNKQFSSPKNRYAKLAVMQFDNLVVDEAFRNQKIASDLVLACYGYGPQIFLRAARKTKLGALAMKEGEKYEHQGNKHLLTRRAVEKGLQTHAVIICHAEHDHVQKLVHKVACQLGFAQNHISNDLVSTNVSQGGVMAGFTQILSECPTESSVIQGMVVRTSKKLDAAFRGEGYIDVVRTIIQSEWSGETEEENGILSFVAENAEVGIRIQDRIIEWALANGAIDCRNYGEEDYKVFMDTFEPEGDYILLERDIPQHRVAFHIRLI